MNYLYPTICRQLLSAASALVLSVTFAQQDGDLDLTFADNGKFIHDFGFQDNLTKVRVQPWDQKIVAVGSALSQAFAGQLLVVRLLPDGTPDTGFDGDGFLTITTYTESYAYDLFFQDDEKIVIAGAAADPSYQFSTLLMRLNADGSLDTSFDTDGFATPELSTADDFAYAVAPLADGRILIAGKALNDQFMNAPVIARFNADGSLDTSFGTNGQTALPVTQNDNTFSSIGLLPDGRIIASGHLDQGLTTDGQFNFDVLLARFTVEGQLDNGFGTDGIVTAPVSANYVEKALGQAIGADGNILVCGYTTQLDFSFDAILMEFDVDGATVNGFGTNGITVFDQAVQDVAYGIALQDDGKILITGTSGGFFFDDRDQLLARYLADGTTDNTFSTDGFVLTTILEAFDEANALTLQADGKIIVAGKGSNGTNNDVSILRHENDLSTFIGSTLAAPDLLIWPSPAAAGASVYVAGRSAIASVQVIDATGRTVVQPAVQRASSRMDLPLPGSMANGIYTVRINGTDGQVRSARLLVNGR